MKLTAYLYCNLHGIWKYEKEVKIEWWDKMRFNGINNN
jgi:hypothetical protein